MAPDVMKLSRLNERWLGQGEPTEDPWILETSSPNCAGDRDAFLGNGYIGQRIGRGGDASAFSPDKENCSGPCSALIHGLWGEHMLIPPPRWAILTYHNGKMLFADNTEQMSNYRQRLDLKTGILDTEVDWNDEGRKTHVETRIYISRTRPHVCFLSRTIRPDFDGVVSITDELDGVHLDDAKDWSLQHGEKADDPMSMELTVGPQNRRLVVLSRLVLKGVVDAKITRERFNKRLSRTLSFKVTAGGTYSVTKLVALVTDHDSPGPLVTAWTQVEGAAGDLEKLERDHIDAWHDLWRHRIEVSSTRLQKLINATLYQFYSQLRAGGAWSLGPTGLTANYWGGHVFWDSDLWMFPVLGLLNPALAKGFIDYRSNTLEGSIRNARADGYEGAQISWESAEFGDETIPNLVYHRQHHVNSDVALAQWWFWKITGDDDYLRAKSGRVIVECAKFWASRVIHNEKIDRYEIHGVCCADEFAEIQNNNAYTNYSAVRTLRLAKAVSEKLGWPVSPKWSEIADKLWVPFDEVNQRFFEYEGYSDQIIKQADTALLIYPYEMPMPREVKSNVVNFYRGRYPEDKIMMSSAFDGIVDCELGSPRKAWESLGKLMPHFEEPFLLASESPENGKVSFATGLGGLLQLIVMGFAGVRIHEEGLQVQPCFPPEITHLQLFGIHYGGICFDLRLQNDKVMVENPTSPINFRIEDAQGKSWI